MPYQREVDVDMLNAVKSMLADVSSVSPSSERKKKGRGLRYRCLYNYEMDNRLYQLKVDVGLLNTVKNELANVSSVGPSSEQCVSNINFHF